MAAGGLITGSAGLAAAATTPSSAQAAATAQACTGSGYWGGYWTWEVASQQWIWTWVWYPCAGGWVSS
jgi:hypothetical protein